MACCKNNRRRSEFIHVFISLNVKLDRVQIMAHHPWIKLQPNHFHYFALFAVPFDSYARNNDSQVNKTNKLFFAHIYLRCEWTERLQLTWIERFLASRWIGTTTTPTTKTLLIQWNELCLIVYVCVIFPFISMYVYCSWAISVYSNIFFANFVDGEYESRRAEERESRTAWEQEDSGAREQEDSGAREQDTTTEKIRREEKSKIERNLKERGEVRGKRAKEMAEEKERR